MLRPFFPYYGSKWRSARLYGPPRHEHVVEPFAGSAGYACYYQPARVTLIDADPIIAGLWEYLTRASLQEILLLPDLEAGDDVRDHAELPQEARWLIGFWINRGSAQPCNIATTYSSVQTKSQLLWSERARQRIATQIDEIRHWRILNQSYADAERVEATWFVDPPYVEAGRRYKHRDVDHQALGAWCQTLPGQVFACENEGATWLPFRVLSSIKSSRGRSVEAVWTNQPNGDPMSRQVPGQLPFDDQGDDQILVDYVKAAGWLRYVRGDGAGLPKCWRDPDPPTRMHDDGYKIPPNPNGEFHTLGEAVLIQRQRDVEVKREQEGAAEPYDPAAFCVCGHPRDDHRDRNTDPKRPGCSMCFRCPGFWDVTRGPAPKTKGGKR